MTRDIDFDENARICLTLEKENSFTVAVKEGIKAIVDGTFFFAPSMPRGRLPPQHHRW